MPADLSPATGTRGRFFLVGLGFLACLLALLSAPAAAEPLFLTASSRQPVEGAYFSAARAAVYLDAPWGSVYLGLSGGPTSVGWPTVPGVEPKPSDEAATVLARLQSLSGGVPPTVRIRFEHEAYRPLAIDVPAAVLGPGRNLWPAKGCVQMTPLAHTVTFETAPPGAEVHLQTPDGLFLGRGGEPAVLLLPVFLGSEQRFVDRTAVYVREGYQSRAEILRPALLLAAARWPTEGAVVLAPASTWVALRDGLARFGLPLGLTGGVVVVALLAARRRRPASSPTVTTPVVAPQRVLGRWRLDGKIGQGGYATVYRALPVDGPEEAVAVKILDDEAAQEASDRLRFEREVEISCRLSHPNIVRVIDWGFDDDACWLAMELLEGPSLNRLIAKGPLPLEQFAVIFRALLDGTAYAHAQGVVHRDLKPGNVLTTARGLPKLVDFGIARGQRFATVTTTGRAIGTMAYLPPERFVAAIADDPRSDQYALGIMAWEMLAGTRPYPDTALGEVLLGIVREPPPDLKTLRPEVPPAAIDVVLRMMSLGLDDRYPTIADARAAFQQALAD